MSNLARTLLVAGVSITLAMATSPAAASGALVGVGKADYYGCLVGTGLEVAFAGTPQTGANYWNVVVSWHVNGVFVNGGPGCMLTGTATLTGTYSDAEASCLSGSDIVTGQPVFLCFDPDHPSFEPLVWFSLCGLGPFGTCGSGNAAVVGA